jgi:hypothetical protein
MATWQAILLGVMLAWSPSLVWLALMLWRTMEGGKR